jgi:molybdopterin converting factor subunit 1
MKILYFASLRRSIGVGEEDVTPPPDIDRVDALITWLKARTPAHAAAFAACRRLNVAVNQEHAGLDHPLTAGDEVAFFPPVTGGCR